MISRANCRLDSLGRDKPRTTVGLIVVICTVVLVHGDTPSTVSDQPDCPVTWPCPCEFDDLNRTIVNCRRQGLTAVPTFTPSSVEIYELTLADNNIGSIPASAFDGLHITRLDMASNAITQFDNDAFRGVSDVLRELQLQLGPSTPFPTTPISVLTGLRLLHVEAANTAATSLPVGALAALTSLESLTLTSYSLGRLTSDDVISQVSTLSYLDLSSNQLETVPSQALKTLSNLAHIDLKSNKITVIESNSFSSLPGVRFIDLSYNAIERIGDNAFVPLASTLSVLSMSFCRLTDTLLKTLGPLKNLTTLNIDNNMITNIDRLFDGMNSLRELNARKNNIASLSRSTFQSTSKSLKSLHLQLNPSMVVSEDAFSRLGVLEELFLDDAHQVQLSDGMFHSQQRTLRSLSLRSTNIGSGEIATAANGSSSLPWSAFRGLTALQNLYLSKCSLTGAVPDFVFVQSANLQTIDLSGNAIDFVSQRSLAGLQNALSGISLASNMLQTLDQCVFYQFTGINIFQVDLTNNPLVCDCRIKWLYDRLQMFRNNSRFSSVTWTCASDDGSSGGRLFISLDESDFDSCASTSIQSTCEDLTPTTRLPVSASTDRARSVVVRVNQTRWTSAENSSRNLFVVWTISQNFEFTSLAVTCRRHDSSTADVYPIAAISYDGSYVISGLTPGTIYEVCIDVGTSSQGTVTECAPGATTGSSTSTANLSLILGVAIGSTVALLIIIVVVVWCCVAAAKRRERDAKAMLELTAATNRPVQTKRFRKQNTSMTSADMTSDTGGGQYGLGAGGGQRAITEADFDRALVSTVERMDPQSKDLLASLLRTASVASMDRLGSGATLSTNFYVHNRRSYDGDDDGGDANRHIYEELPNDDTYDTIPTDDTV